MSETALTPSCCKWHSVSGTPSAEPSAGIHADYDVIIVIPDALDDHGVKFDFGQFCNSADDESHIGPVGGRGPVVIGRRSVAGL